MYRRTKGFTLIELLVAIGLFTIIVTIAVAGFTNALRTQREVSSLIETQSNMSLALEQMTREMRTSYFFCHDPSAPTSAVPSPSCGCTISDSGYTPPIAPANPAELYPSGDPNGDLPTWTCSSIDYYTSDGTHVSYTLQNGQLMRDDGSGPQSITGSNVSVHNLTFILFGNIEGDNWTPRITIAIGVAPSSTDPATENDVLNLQTTVSSRLIDCVQGTSEC